MGKIAIRKERLNAYIPHCPLTLRSQMAAKGSNGACLNLQKTTSCDIIKEKHRSAATTHMEKTDYKNYLTIDKTYHSYETATTQYKGRTYDVLNRVDAAAVLYGENGRIALVRQYRPAVKSFTLEIPAGKIEAGETPLHCAIRELEEEIGYRTTPDHVKPLGSILAAPGYSNERIWLYVCWEAEFVGAHPDDDEDTETEWIDLTEFMHGMQITGPFEEMDAKTICALTTYMLGWAASHKTADQYDEVVPLEVENA